MPDPNTVSGAFTATYYTVTSLPPAASQQGNELWVTDASINPAIGSGGIATGGGTNRTRVQSDGTNWRIAGWTVP